jgi:hypothetical protein
MGSPAALVSIASGVPYLATLPEGRPAVSVGDFLGSVSFLVHQRNQHSLVAGVGVLDNTGTAVRFYQKDSDHDGRDVRIWRIRLTGDRFTAEHLAAI